MKKKLEYPIVFIIGAVYGIIERLFRGHTHWTMFILGGICFCLLYIISNYSRLTLPEKWLIGTVTITALEFFVGGLLNLTLGWRVWTYAHYPMNIFGQVCLAFSLLWFAICILVCPICIRLKAAIHGFGARKTTV